MNRYFHSILPTPRCDDDGNNIYPNITIISDNAASRLHGSTKMPSSSSSSSTEPIPALRRTTSLPNHPKLSSSSSKKLAAASACRSIASHKVNNRPNAIPIARSTDRQQQQQQDRLYELRRMRRHSDNTLPDQLTTMETLPEQKLRTSLSMVSLKGNNNKTTTTSMLGKQQQQQLSSLPFDRRKISDDHNIQKQPSGQQALFWTTSIVQSPLSCLSPPRMPQRQSSFSSLLPHSSSSSSSISSSHSKETTKISDQRNASW